MEGRRRFVKAWVVWVLSPSLEKVGKDIWASGKDVNTMQVGLKGLLM